MARPRTTSARPQRVRRQRSVTESLGSIVLTFELVIVFLGALVAFGLGALPPVVALIGGAALCLLMAFTAGTLRHRWGVILGWAVQGIILATGFALPAMFIVGGIFAGIWIYSMVVGTRLDRHNASERAAATPLDTDPQENGD